MGMIGGPAPRAPTQHFALPAVAAALALDPGRQSRCSGDGRLCSPTIMVPPAADLHGADTLGDGHADIVGAAVTGCAQPSSSATTARTSLISAG